MSCADFTFYTDVYHGSLLSQDNFTALLPRAESYLNNITRSRSQRGGACVANAACAVTEELWRIQEAPCPESESVGTYTIHYGASAASPAARLYAAAALYLYGTDLLYMGI